MGLKRSKMKKLEVEMFVSAPLFFRSETVCVTTKLFHFLSLLIWCYRMPPSTNVPTKHYTKGFIFSFLRGDFGLLITFYDFSCVYHIHDVYLQRIKTTDTMKAIINKDGNFGTLNGVITKNSEIQTAINQHLKAGTAKKLVDTETTLMYELGEKPNSNLHPIFAEALKPFGIR